MENPQKPTKLSPRSSTRHLVGKRTAQKDINKDITSDSQVNSYFPYWWSPASLTFNIYFYLFLYLTRLTINNDTPHLKSPKNQNRRAALGRPAIFILKTLIVNNICYSSHVIRNTREVIFHTTLLEELKQSSVMTKKMIKERMEDLKMFLKRLKYPLRLIEEGIKKALTQSQNDLINYRQNQMRQSSRSFLLIIQIIPKCFELLKKISIYLREVIP